MMKRRKKNCSHRTEQNTRSNVIMRREIQTRNEQNSQYSININDNDGNDEDDDDDDNYNYKHSLAFIYALVLKSVLV